MTQMRKFVLAAGLLAGLALADVAAAHGNISCDTPRAERRKGVDLQKELKAKGWTVRKIQLLNGCYEVYGFDPMGKKVEAFFHPKTFERLRSE